MEKFDPEFGFSEEVEVSWRTYLRHFFTHVYPMFEEHGISRDAALSAWFTNRLRNAMDDDDTSNEPWKL